MARLFGTDGVRGVANSELTPELAFKLGRAAACLFGKDKVRPEILIGRDTRISGPMLEAAMAAGICSAGGQAVLAGVVPTPAVAYLTQQIGAQAGVVISASHNSFSDNGIKFFAADGYKLPDAVEDRLADMATGVDHIARPIGDEVGTIQYRHDLIEQYISHVTATIPDGLRGIKIVMDCANGASYEVAPRVLRKLGAKVIVLNDSPDGVNINEQCGSTHLASIQQAVIDHKADLGIANDGDADRCLAVDENGMVVDGDQIMVICALELLRAKKLPQDTLVVTVMSNIGLHLAMKKAGGKVEVTAVGDRYVLEAMRKSGLGLGGEQSGHIVFNDYATTGDGVVTALQLMAVMKKTGQKLSALAQCMIIYPQVLVNVRVKSKEGWEDNANIKSAIAAAEQALGTDGRLLVRPSGTEPLIRVMAEGPDIESVKKFVQQVADVIQKELL